MKKHLRGLIAVLMIIIMFSTISITTYAEFNHTDCISNSLEYLTKNEVKAFFINIYGFDPEQEMNTDENIRMLYQYMTGGLEKGSDRYMISQIALLETFYPAFNANIDSSVKKYEQNRVDLIGYLTKKAGGDTDSAVAQEFVNEALGGVKSAVKSLCQIMCDNPMVDLTISAIDAYKSITGLKDKVQSYVDDMTAALNAIQFYRNRNITLCLKYLDTYLSCRPNAEIPEYGIMAFESLLGVFTLNNMSELDALNPVFDFFGKATWTDDDTLHFFRRIGEFIYHTEKELNSYKKPQEDHHEEYDYVINLNRTNFVAGDKLREADTTVYKTDKAAGHVYEQVPFSQITLTYNFSQAGANKKITVSCNGATKEFYVNVDYGSGYCGDLLDWVLKYDGTLIISGRGDMWDWTSGKAPWYSFRDKIVSLSIGSRVTSIGDYAFYYCSSLKGNLKIPDSVTNIGDSAFSYCSGFTGSLTIPDSVTSIGDSAFSYCSGFTGSLTIPDSVTSIGDSAFCYCRNLSGNLTIPNSVTNIGVETFSYCSGFTGNLIIPNSVTDIGFSAFYDCYGFTGSLTIPDSVTIIGDYAFSYCSSFTGNLTIPNNVVSIGDSAFLDCSGFTGSLTIPDSVISIGNYAFSECSGFTGSLTISDNVTSIGDYAFWECGFTGSLTIPGSVSTIGDHAFEYCHGFTGNLTILGGVTSIGHSAFMSCSGFTGNLSIPNSVVTIGTFAFFGCSGLSGSLTIPSSVTSIGEGSFSVSAQCSRDLRNSSQSVTI